jgi:IS66 C-terminal element
MIASIIETCKLIGLDPHRHLADVITRIVNGHPIATCDLSLFWYPLPQRRRRHPFSLIVTATEAVPQHAEASRRYILWRSWRSPSGFPRCR